MSRFVKLLARLHRDEQGAEKVEYLLILAAVALPILGALMYYKGQLFQWVENIWSTTGGAGVNDPTQGMPGQ